MGKKRVGLVLLLSIILAAFRTVVVIFNMEKNSYEKDTYYLLDNAMSNAFLVLFFISLAVGAVIAVLVGKGKKAIPDQKSDVVSAASCMLAFILLGTVIIYVVNYVMSGEFDGGLSLVIALLSVLSAIAFLMTGFKVYSENLLGVMALLPMALTVFRILNDFINSNSAPFASSGAYHITSLAVLLLYFLCEGKAFINKGSAALYYLFGYGAAILLAVYAMPNLLLHCFGIFNFDYNASLSVADILTVAYIFARLSSAKLVPAKE